MNIKASRRAFIDALRSGKYTQTAHRYRSKDHTCHCALGVGIDALDLWDKPSSGLGLVLEDALGENSAFFYDVTAWNDNKHLTFDEIADRLETRWNL